MWPVNTSLQTSSGGSPVDKASCPGTSVEEEDAGETYELKGNSRTESESEEHNKENQRLDGPTTSERVSNQIQCEDCSSPHLDSDTSKSREGTLHKEPKCKGSSDRLKSPESTLREEFDGLNVLEHSRVLKIEDLSEARRVCKVSSTLLVPPNQTMLRIFLRINFPSGYPSTSPPVFVYGKGAYFDTHRFMSRSHGRNLENEQGRRSILRPALLFPSH